MKNEFGASGLLVAAVLAGAAVLTAVQLASAQGGASAWYGKSVTATVLYQNRIRVNGQEQDSVMKFDLNLNISGDGTVTGSAGRSSEGRRGPIARSQSISATIGKPKEVQGSGHSVIVVSGNTLTILRTWEVGGAKITVNMQGGGRCTINAPVMREVGAGTTKRDHINSGTVEVLSSRQVSSSCSVR